MDNASSKVETGSRGQRVSRKTTDKHGKWCKPKYTTYSSQQCIVDGDDGKTYILAYTADYNFISIHRHDFMSANPGSIFPQDEGYAAVKALLDSVG